MMKVFAEGISSIVPSREVLGASPPRPRVEVDYIGLQVMCPQALHVFAYGEQLTFEGDCLRLQSAECQLHAGEEGAILRFEGAVKASMLEGGATLKQVLSQGSFTIRDVAADAVALKCPDVKLQLVCHEDRAWKPGAKVRFSGMLNKSFEGKRATLVEWLPRAGKWRVRLDGREDSFSASQDKLRLCALPWDIRLDISQPVELSASDYFTNRLHEHALVLADVFREASLLSTALRQRPLGLRIDKGDVVAVAGFVRESGLLPGGRVIAVGSTRQGNVDLSTCSLPTILLTSPAPPEVTCNWRTSAFELHSRRIGSAGGTALQSKVNFREDSRTDWGPGLLSDLLRDVQDSYTKALLLQSPQVLANLQGDFVEGATSALQAAASGVNLAMRQTKAEMRNRQSPVTSFDDLGRFPAEDIIRATQPLQRRPSGLQAAADVGNFFAKGLRNAQESLAAVGTAPGAGYPSAIAGGSQPFSSRLPAPPAENSAAALGSQAVSTGIQVAGDLSRLMGQAVQNAQSQGRQRGQQGSQRPHEPCKQQ